MLNSKKEWVEINPFSGAASSGGNAGGSTTPDENPDDIIYEGGLV